MARELNKIYRIRKDIKKPGGSKEALYWIAGSWSKRSAKLYQLPELKQALRLMILNRQIYKDTETIEFTVEEFEVTDTKLTYSPNYILENKL